AEVLSLPARRVVDIEVADFNRCHGDCLFPSIDAHSREGVLRFKTVHAYSPTVEDVYSIGVSSLKIADNMKAKTAREKLTVGRPCAQSRIGLALSVKFKMFQTVASESVRNHPRVRNILDTCGLDPPGRQRLRSIAELDLIQRTEL